MVIEFIYIPIILFLYLRTYKYNVLIDDPVPRDGYMYVITYKKADPALYEVRRSWLATFTNIGVFIAVCAYIHYLWGWKAALLFSVFPLNVSGVAWTTGNYYMTTVLLILSTHMILIKYQLLGALGSLLIYTAALNSTLSSIPYIVIALLYPYGWFLIYPLMCFLFGKRMKSGLTQRKALQVNAKVSAGFRVSNLLLCPKVIAYYIQMSLFPIKLGFFQEWGRGTDFRKKRTLVLSCVLCLLFWVWLLSYDWVLAIWWFVSIAIFSQFAIYGMFIAERYTYVANVAFCVILSQFLTNDIVLTLVLTSWFYRSLDYIPAWRHNVNLFSYSITQFPHTPENYNNLGSYFFDKGNPYEAIKPLLAAEKLAHGKKHKVRANIASAYAMMGDNGNPEYYKHAIKWAVIAKQDCPTDQVGDFDTMIQRLNNRLVDYRKAVKRGKKGRDN